MGAVMMLETRPLPHDRPWRTNVLLRPKRNFPSSPTRERMAWLTRVGADAAVALAGVWTGTSIREGCVS